MHAGNVQVVVGAWSGDQLPGSLVISLMPDPGLRNGQLGEQKKVERQLQALRTAGDKLYVPEMSARSGALEALNYTQLDHLPDWAYRRYQVGVQTVGEVDLAAVNPFQEFIYLFDVLVALEWHPNQDDLLQLRWAFRRASDYLFDVTNGWMGFAQVVVGGPELMEAADIQIMASNRLHPRSWVGGMADNVRNMPIRTGRGLWHDRQQFAIPWEEPEAYRVLIHEWSHYALNLIDEYPSQPSKRRRHDVEFSIVIPEIMPGKETIMAGTSGISELDAQQWASLHLTFAEVNRQYQPNKGPQQLLNEFPRFYLTRAQSEAEPQSVAYFPSWRQDAYAELSALLSDAPSVGQSWIYLLREGQHTPDGQRRIIAQGALDARWQRAGSNYPGMRLLGAQKDDQVILINSRPGAALQVLKGLVDGSEQELRVGMWQSVTPDTCPLIEVIPELGSNQPVPVRVRVSAATVAGVSLFPLGQGEQLLTRDASRSTESVWTSEPVEVATLDGHILVQSGAQILITSFSQGGGPPFHTPGPANPITGGSSDGTAMLFFYSDQLAKDTQSDMARAEAERHSRTKVVTTLNYGLDHPLPEGLRAASYAFTIASNQQLPSDLFPTLVLYYELTNQGELDQGDVTFQVCKLANGIWEPQVTSVAPFGSSFAALPLSTSTGPQPGGTLVADGDIGAAPRSETYLVCWQG